MSPDHPQPSYLRALWLQIKANHRKEIALHSIFGIVTPIVASCLEFLHSVKHGPATFNRDEIVRPLGSAIIAYLVTVSPYLMAVFITTNKRLYVNAKARSDSLQTRVATLEAEADAREPKMNIEIIEDEPGTLRVTNSGGDTKGVARIKIKEIQVDESLGGSPIPTNLSFGGRWLDATDSEGYVNFHKNVPHLLRLAERTNVGGPNTIWRIHYVEHAEPTSIYFTSRPRGGVPTAPLNRALIAVTLSYQGMTRDLSRTYEIAGAAFREVSPGK